MEYYAQSMESVDGARQQVEQARTIFERIGESIFNADSVVVFTLSIVLALLIGRLVASILRRLTKYIGSIADKTEDLDRVNKLRRLETLIVLSIAAIRTLLVIFAIYYWWVYTHDNQESTAILGAGAILTIILSGALFNTLRDIASGSVMMAEQWYGVGDFVSIEPFEGAAGVVERVTLRSTRIRKVTGEVLWINNKDIAGVSISPKGVRTIALELFSNDYDKGVRLIEDANLRLPQGAVAVVSLPTIMTVNKLGDSLWHFTAISEVAPGREWLIDKYALEIIKELDEKRHTLVHEPITRYADNEAERRFARSITNARKQPVVRPNLVRQAVNKQKKAAKARASAKTSKPSQ